MRLPVEPEGRLAGVIDRRQRQRRGHILDQLEVAQIDTRPLELAAQPAAPLVGPDAARQAMRAPARAAISATLATEPPKCGTNMSASSSELTGRSQIMSTSASPRQRTLREAVGISAFTRRARYPQIHAPTLVAAALAAAYLIVQPTGADLPAQLLRARLFGAEGFGIWNNWWYAGQNVTGYSVLFPPLAWLLSPQLVAALACVGTAAAFEALSHDVYGDDAWLGATWLAAATVTELLSGRLTFAFGLCGVALTALLLERRRPRSAAVLACVTALASPVAGLFAALAGLVGRRPSGGGRVAVAAGRAGDRLSAARLPAVCVRHAVAAARGRGASS